LWPNGGGSIETPGLKVTGTLAPRSETLLSAYSSWTGANPSAYSGVVPPHLFPQWGFPLMAKALRGLPYKMTKVLNQGCRLEVKAALPSNEPLVVAAWLSEVREEAHRVRITSRIVTGTASTPECLVADVYAVVPTGKKPAGDGKRSPPVVPDGHRLLTERSWSRRSGLDFALLTGDFNPIHWVGPYAKVAGFKSVILHGFASMALAWEAIVNEELGGDPDKMKWMDLRFVRPQILPGHCGVYVGDGGAFAVGVGPDERATTLGTYGVEDDNG